MAFQGVGDLAQSFQLRRENARLQDELRTLTNELSSGRTSDLGRTVSGDFGALSGLERSLSAITAYETAATETRLMAETAQSTLELVRSKGTDNAQSLLLASGDFQPGLVDAAVETAARAFEDAVSALNIRVGDRSVFAGIATDGPAIAAPDIMLNELDVLVAGETTAAGVATIVSDWFGPGGGFETVGYLGDTTAISDIPVSQDESVTLDVTAADQGVRDVLAGLAMAALIDRGALSTEIEARGDLARTAGNTLMQADYEITATRARIGITQERIEDAETRNASEAQTLELARAELVEIDPFETAARLASLEVQLETLYAVTARLSRLTLSDYIR
ncbi:MAG: flagellin [Pseudomonadota bacterium]